ncbi:MAG TPA: PPK2 family polyphosphate kinase [Limnobacter sp.]|nr:PPK2 family polyphosphate kinase [Limnobacter sp.]
MTKAETKIPKRKEIKRSEKVLPDALVPESQWEILGQACMVNGKAVRLRQWPTRYGDMPSKEDMHERVDQLSERLNSLLTCLYAQGEHKLLVILQGMDTAGKDGAARAIMRAVHPMALRMESFKEPSAFEAAHDFLWRVHSKVPAAGQSVIFNRSHYDGVIVPLVQGQLTPTQLEEKIRQVNDFEKLLNETGTTVLKIFLNLSREEQHQRMIERWESPEKRWKLTERDLHCGENFSLYANAYEQVLEKTCTKDAPWWIIPADHKGFRNMLVAEILVGTLERMGLAWPEPDPAVAKSEFWKKPSSSQAN